MTQRTWAALLAVPLFVALGLYVATAGLPFVTYAPGLTLNVLGKNGGKPIIQVQGHRTYRDKGELRMTTVSVTEPNARLDLMTLMRTWFQRDDAIYPFTAVYSPDETQQQSSHAGQQQMLSSQQAAAAAALSQLGYHVARTSIEKVTPGMPADGKLKVGDVLVSVGGTPASSPDQVAARIQKVPDGQSVPVVVDRNGREVSLRLTPVKKDGHQLIGVTLSTDYHFPFKVRVNLSSDIGGPSAGLMFALSMYDVLTPGSLTGGQSVAGTGTISADGQVGEIGGIQQKIAGARADGAQLFLVPPANCADAVSADNGAMRLAKAATLHAAIRDVKAWSANHDAHLPSCKAAS